jgi:hypothetical protein
MIISREPDRKIDGTSTFVIAAFGRVPDFEAGSRAIGPNLAEP